MTGSHADFMRRWFDQVWNLGRAEAIEAMLAPNGRVHGLGEADAVATGPAEFRWFWTQFCEAFPTRRFTVEDVVESGDKVAVRWRARLIHGGDALGPAPTGKEVVVTGIAFAHVRDGQLQEGWNNWDSLELARQIEALAPIRPILPRA